MDNTTKQRIIKTTEVLDEKKDDGYLIQPKDEKDRKIFSN